jgi:SOS-response transcriptional repressor LexA
VLAQYRGPADPDTGGSYTIKRYSSEQVHLDGDDWKHTRIVLSPTNRDYQPIVIDRNDDESISIVGEYIAVLRGME